MNVLVIGDGGREDAICRKISENAKVKKIFCIMGNAGTERYAKNVYVDKTKHIDVLMFAKRNDIDLCIIGPEASLADGLSDLLRANGIKVFGPGKRVAKLESSKEFAKEFMQRHDIPTAKYVSKTNLEEAKEALKEFSYPLVIKADGLCAGKGVAICKNEEDANNYLKELFIDEIFGEEGKKVVIEEFLEGEEASLMCFVSGKRLIPMQSARDYKRVFDNDQGPNTGGVGAYSPSELFEDEKLQEKVEDLIEQIEDGFMEDNISYSGVLFIGLMIKDGVPKVLEFNVRFGDPETQVVLHRLKCDLLDVIEKSIEGTLKEEDLSWRNKKALTVILYSGGYPGKYERGKVITGLDDIDSSVYVYHNNTAKPNDEILTDGGRVLSVTGLGRSIEEIRENVYKNIEKIHFDGMGYRKDIGK